MHAHSNTAGHAHATLHTHLHALASHAPPSLPGYVVERSDGCFEVTAKGRTVSEFGGLLPLHLAEFVVLANTEGAGDEAAAAAAFIHTMAQWRQPFLDPHKAFASIRNTFKEVSSDLMLVCRLFAHFRQTRPWHRKERCVSMNMKLRVMVEAELLYHRLGRISLPWTYWRRDYQGLILVLESAMLQTARHLLAHASVADCPCHQTSQGLLVKCREDTAVSSPSVLPLDIRPAWGDGPCKARLALLLSPPTEVLRALILSDSTLKTGLRQAPLLGAVCQRLRNSGYVETVWRQSGKMRVQKAIELVEPLKARLDVGVVVMNPNDAMVSPGIVRGEALDDVFWSALANLLQLLATRCAKLTVVAPTYALFSKYHGVWAYKDSCDALRAFYRERGVHCVDASELVDVLRTDDGEHFADSCEPALVDAVELWVSEASPVSHALGSQAPLPADVANNAIIAKKARVGTVM